MYNLMKAKYSIPKWTTNATAHHKFHVHGNRMTRAEFFSERPTCYNLFPFPFPFGGLNFNQTRIL